MHFDIIVIVMRLLRVDLHRSTYLYSFFVPVHLYETYNQGHSNRYSGCQAGIIKSTSIVGRKNDKDICKDNRYNQRYQNDSIFCRLLVREDQRSASTSCFLIYHYYKRIIIFFVLEHITERETTKAIVLMLQSQ